jgi:uncharacterized protein (DUF305 family)
MRLKWILIAILFSAGASAQVLKKPAGVTFMDNMAIVMKRMDKDMAAAPMTGDVDHYFAQMMIPHHQGAIEMAKSELLYGKDPVMRRLAQEILVDQQSEIDAMGLWLKKQGGSKTSGLK